MHTRIPDTELAFLKGLKDIKIVFDVGARTDTDYFDIWPKAEFHLFEPNPFFFEELKTNVGDRKKVHLNNFGLGDMEGEYEYCDGRQAFRGGELKDHELPPDRALYIKTINGYCAEKGITQIDFLKIDTEGYDYKVLQGASNVLSRTRYLQYEYWDDKLIFHDLLEDNYYMNYIGGRNVLCTRKNPISNA